MRGAQPGPEGRSISGPRAARALARLLLPSRDREFILGDLEEMYALRAAREGHGPAARRYLRDVLASAAARVVARIAHSGGRRPSWHCERRSRPGRPGSGLLGDVGAAFRTLRREKGFAALVVLTLGLGVGSAAVVFGMADQLLLRPLPGVHDAGRAAYLRFHAPAESDTARQHNLSMPVFDEVRRSATLLDGIAAYGFDVLRVSGEASRMPVATATIYGDYFEILGVRPAAGRLLSASETTAGDDPFNVVISQRLSERMFGSPAAAIGRTIRVNRGRVTVVGVAGGGFAGSQRIPEIGLWISYAGAAALGGFLPGTLHSRGRRPLGLFIVRTRRGVGAKATEAQVTDAVRAATSAGDEDPGVTRPRRIVARLTPGIGTQPDRRPGIERSLRIVGGIVALVLLIACGNAANLLLFRNVRRRGAVATRRALGASRGRIAREHLVVGLLLGMMGVAAGIGVGWLLSLVLRGHDLEGMPTFTTFPIDVRVALFAGSAAIVTTLLFGAFPAVLAGRFDLASTLRKAAGRHTGRMATLRSALSAGQLGLTLTLLVGSLLLVRTVHNLYAADTGFDPDGVSYMIQEHAGDLDAARIEALGRRVLAAVRAEPGVREVALGPPDLDTRMGTSTVSLVRTDAAPGRHTDARLVPVTPGWFGIYRIAAVRGRILREDDGRDGGPVEVVVTASLARRLFGEAAAVGRRLSGSFGSSTREMRVVGVVRDISTNASPDVPEDAVFLPQTAAPPSFVFFLLARTRDLEPATWQGVRKAVHSVLPGEPVIGLRPVSGLMESAHSEQMFLSHLLALLTGLAALLAGVGLYGVIAFIVAGRRREVGIRIALGAHASRIAWLLFRPGMLIIGVGTVLGLGGAYVLSRGLRSRLFGVGPLDPSSYLGGAALLALVAALACWIPVRRAMRVDPVTTLREE